MSVLLEPHQELLLQGLEEKWKSLGYVQQETNDSIEEAITEWLKRNNKENTKNDNS